MHVNLNGIETRYVLSNEGGGPWLTFIHQLGGDLSIWDQLAGYFRDDFTVLRYDVRGHGETAVPAAPFSVADLSGDLAALLDALGVTKTHVVGMSMGGMIAQQFALDHPSRVETLTLADTSGGTPPEARSIWDQRASAAQRDGVAALVPLRSNAGLRPTFAPRTLKSSSRSATCSQAHPPKAMGSRAPHCAISTCALDWGRFASRRWR